MLTVALLSLSFRGASRSISYRIVAQKDNLLRHSAVNNPLSIYSRGCDLLCFTLPKSRLTGTKPACLSDVSTACIMHNHGAGAELETAS